MYSRWLRATCRCPARSITDRKPLPPFAQQERKRRSVSRTTSPLVHHHQPEELTMSRVPLIDRNATTPGRKHLLDAIHAPFGTTPTLSRPAANPPAPPQLTWGAVGAPGNGVHH